MDSKNIPIACYAMGMFFCVSAMMIFFYKFSISILLQSDASVGDLVQLLVVGSEDNGFASCF